MPQSNVRNLVRHYAGQLRLVVGGGNRFRVHVNRTARQREGVNSLLRDDLERIRIVGRLGHPCQLLAQLRNIALELRSVAQESDLFLDFLRRLLPELDVLIPRKQVEARLDLVLGKQARGREQRDRASHNTWRTLQRAGSRLVSTLVPQTNRRRDESPRGTRECMRQVSTSVTVLCEAL